MTVEVADSLAAALAAHGLIASRRSITGDGSVLLQYLEGRQAGIDVFPDGEVVVIVKDGANDNVFEFDAADVEQIVELIAGETPTYSATPGTAESAR